jgi:hypothetical protein
MDGHGIRHSSFCEAELPGCAIKRVNPGEFAFIRMMEWGQKSFSD